MSHRGHHTLLHHHCPSFTLSLHPTSPSPSLSLSLSHRPSLSFIVPTSYSPSPPLFLHQRPSLSTLSTTGPLSQSPSLLHPLHPRPSSQSQALPHLLPNRPFLFITSPTSPSSSPALSLCHRPSFSFCPCAELSGPGAAGPIPGLSLQQIQAAHTHGLPLTQKAVFSI